MKKPPTGIGLYLITLKSGQKKYQSRLWNPVLGRIGKKKTWYDTDLNVVIQKHAALKKQYQDSGYNIIKEAPVKKSKYPELLVQCAGFYERYLKDDPSLVPAHKAKNRKEKHIKNTVQYIKSFIQCLQEEGWNVSHTHISAIDDESVSIFYNQLESRYVNNEIGEHTWNHHFIACRSWFNTLINTFGYKLENPFVSVTVKSIYTDPQFLEMNEFELFLATITEDNGWGMKGSERVNYYRPWLKELYILDVFIGARPVEFFNLSWPDVTDNYVVVENSKKKNNARLKSEKEYVFIHEKLAEVLIHLKSRSKSEFEHLIVPGWENRQTLQTFASKAFIHFFRKSGIGKEVTFYNLRHTYINMLFAAIGEPALTEKHKKETAIKHYLSKKRKLEIQQGKELFNIDVKQFI